MSEGLKPCRRCGLYVSLDGIEVTQTDTGTYTARFECPDCGEVAETCMRHSSEDFAVADVIDDWNRRWTDPALTARIEELEAETIADAVKMAIEQGISLCGVDLKEADLHELDLHGIDLSYADLSYANLYGVNLDGASLACALLVDTNLFAASLCHTCFRGADLHYANLGRSRAIGADFGSADLHTTDLSNADFSDAKLTDVDLRGAKLINTNFTRAILVGADLMSTELDGTVLVGANLDYAGWPLWSYYLHAKIDKRLFCQLLCHTMRLGQSIDDVEVQSLLNDPVALALANQFHHIIEYGKLK